MKPLVTLSAILILASCGQTEREISRQQDAEEQARREWWCSLPQSERWTWSHEEWATLSSVAPWNIRRGQSINNLREEWTCETQL